MSGNAACGVRAYGSAAWWLAVAAALTTLVMVVMPPTTDAAAGSDEPFDQCSSTRPSAATAPRPAAPLAGCASGLSIGDTVWLDIDRDGAVDPGEPGLAGLGVELLDADEAVVGTATTGPLGDYRFDRLSPSTYRVRIIHLPAGLTPTFDRDSGTAAPDSDSGAITLTAGAAPALGPDFGLAPPLGFVAGTVFVERGNDGSLDVAAGDVGLGGVTVELNGFDRWANRVSRSTVTRPDARFFFSDVPDGTYAVTEIQPPGHLDGIDAAGTLATNTANDEHTVVLGAGQVSTGNDFAEILLDSPEPTSGEGFVALVAAASG